MNSDKKKYILVVEDENEISEFLEVYLTSLNYEVCIVQNILEADQIISNRIPDLILLDIMMSWLSGYEYCKILKSKELTKHIPIIFMTARPREEVKTKSKEVGADDFLIKPFETSDLKTMIKKYVK